jgi:hypothetical protein
MLIRAGAAAEPCGYFAPTVFPAHASPGSKIEAFCRRLPLLGKPLLTLPGPENSALLALGAVAIDPARRRSGRVSSHSKARGLDKRDGDRQGHRASNGARWA